MKGLLLKDIYMMKSSIRIFIITLILYFALSLSMKDISMITAFLPLLGMMLTISTFDSTNSDATWVAYALTLPISRKTIAISKYLAGLVFIGGSLLLGLIMCSLFCFITEQNLLDTLSSVAMTTSLYTFILMIMIPLLFKLGPEKARILMMALLAIPFCLFILFKDKLVNFLSGIPIGSNTSILYIIYFILLIIVTMLSIMISIKILKNKEY